MRPPTENSPDVVETLHPYQGHCASNVVPEHTYTSTRQQHPTWRLTQQGRCLRSVSVPSRGESSKVYARHHSAAVHNCSVATWLGFRHLLAVISQSCRRNCASCVTRTDSCSQSHHVINNSPRWWCINVVHVDLHAHAETTTYGS